MEPAGTNIKAIQEEWADEFRELEMAPDWTLLTEEFLSQGRWCTFWRKILRHDSGLTIAIEYARNTGDSESADAYEDEWYEVEAYEETVTKYRKKAA